VAPTLLIGALIAADGDVVGRLAAATEPIAVADDAPQAAFVRNPAAEGWATPPAYTGLESIYFNELVGGDAPIAAPQGSDITIRVTDAPILPVLEGGALAGMESFASLGGGLAEAHGLLSDSGEITVTIDGAELARYPIAMIPDAPPAIELDGRPGATATRALEIAFEASDDYGIVAAWAVMAPEGHDPDSAKGLPLPIIEHGLPLPISGDTRLIADSSIRDHTSHPWAGGEVVLRLHAEDGAEQVTATEPITITLPERYFAHPLARALVEQRRELVFDYGEADRVLDVLQAVTRRPHELLEKPNPGAYLTIRTAIRRLATGIATGTVAAEAPDVIELLWHAALGFEDGDLSAALGRLRAAQERLRQALENGSEEDIRRAIEELRAAMNEYLQQLARQAPQDRQRQQTNPNRMLSQQDLEDMLDRMQRQAESGLRDEARQMLSELNRMLENLQAAQRLPGQTGPGQQAMQDLQEMIQRQRDLSDRTFDELRQSRREQQLGRDGQQMPGQRGRQQPGWGEGQGRGNEHGRQGQNPGEGMGDDDLQGGAPGSGGLAREQEALRRELEGLGRALGSDEAARALEEAARAMGEARDDLRGGETSEAVRDQMEALDRLNEGAQALAQEIQEGQGDTGAQGARQGDGDGLDASRNDPFDRPSSSYGALDGRSTNVPDNALIDRARRLMEELRRRVGESDRPQLELDYLDRLMERF